MPQYLLALYADQSGWNKLSPEEMQKATEKYMAWAQKAVPNASKRLMPDAGKVIRPQGGQAHATDGPYSESKEVLGGLYIIEASDYDDAVKRSLDHPHVQYGGTIELRQIWEM